MRGSVAFLLFSAAGALGACGGGRDAFTPDASTNAGDASVPPPPPTPPSDAGADAGETKNTIAVSGNTLVDENGKPLRLLGVDFDGAEYMCIQDRGIFDGPSDDALADAIAGWRVNVVRMGLNEQCWLGTPSIDARWQGKPYRDAIVAWIARLRARRLYVIVEAHVSSSIEGKATDEQPMIDRAHGIPFWQSIAQTFAGDRGVVFDLYNEPFLDVQNTNHAYNDDPWGCWKDGCIVTAPSSGETYEAAGMQPLLDTVRGAGAENVVMVGGLAYANDLSGVLTHLPSDPKKQLAAAFHVYPMNPCVDASCWNQTVAQVAAAIPLVTGEVGQLDCKGDFVVSYMLWADAKNLSYLGWTFNPGDCTRPSLVMDWSGTPSTYGVALHDHLAALRP
jgi:hypothetical protein